MHINAYIYIINAYIRTYKYIYYAYINAYINAYKSLYILHTYAI